MIDFRNTFFIKSAADWKEAPGDGLKEVLAVGKSNVGKSSLINSLTFHKRLAFTSSKPGHTRLLNYYNVDKRFYLVDAPGYGYAAGGVDLDAVFGKMMDSYFSENNRLSLVLLLLDARRQMGVNDKEILEYVKENNIPYLIVITKKDKINQSEKAALTSHLSTLGVDKKSIFLTSALDNRSMDGLRREIEQRIK